MKPVSYLRIEKRGQGKVIERFTPAMAVVGPKMRGLQPDPGSSGAPAAAGANVPGNQRSRP